MFLGGGGGDYGDFDPWRTHQAHRGLVPDSSDLQSLKQVRLAQEAHRLETILSIRLSASGLNSDTSSQLCNQHVQSQTSSESGQSNTLKHEQVTLDDANSAPTTKPTPTSNFPTQNVTKIDRNSNPKKVSRFFNATSKRREAIASQPLILLLLLSLSRLISSLSISPPSRDTALLRLGRTTVDDDELARTMDRSGPSQEHDDAIGGAELARTRELLNAQESSRVAEVGEQSQTNVTSSMTTTNTAPSSKEELAELLSDTQIASIGTAAPTERLHESIISVINNQSSSVHLGDQVTNNDKTSRTIPADSTQYTSEHLGLLHNVAMDEPEDTIQSLRSSGSSSNVSETEIDWEGQASPQALSNGHDKREERRRKTASLGPQKEASVGGDSSRGSIKSVITRPRQWLVDLQPAAGPKFSVSTKLKGPSSPISRLERANQTTIAGSSIDESSGSLLNNTGNANFTSSLPADQQTILNSNSLKFGSSSEMRAFESATIETTANGKGGYNTTDGGEDDDSLENSGDSMSSLVATTEAPSEEPATTTTNKWQSIDATEKPTTISISTNSDDRNLFKPMSVTSSGSSSGQVKSRPQPKFKATHHELLVGPFKSESDAPDTITLAGVVYQKSGSSSGLPAIFGGAAMNSAASQQGQSATVAGSSMRSVETTSLNAPQNSLLTNNQIKYAPQESQSHKVLAQAAMSQQQQQNMKFHQKDHQQQVAQQWTPQALPSNMQLFLPISQAQLISLLGQPGKLLTSTSQTIAQAAAAASKSKEKAKVSVTFTSIPTGESLLSSLASSLDLKLASPSSMKNNSGVGKTHFASSSSLSQLQTSGDPSDWNSSASQQAAVSATVNGNNNINDATSVEQLYLNSLLSGGGGIASQLESMAMAGSSANKDHIKSHPVVIVEKNVKPVKYHLLRAYLKLRRLLRPSDATYVFPASSLKRGQSGTSP